MASPGTGYGPHMNDQHQSTDDADVQEADARNGEPDATTSGGPATPAPGTDTATGTDPDAKYEQPGYEDKSFGQAVEQDQELADRLIEQTGGDEHEAEQRFEQESTGAPARARQHDD